MTKLQPEQEALLAALCEASRRVRKDTFVAARTFGGESLQHAGIEGSLPEWTWNDLEVLARTGMLLVTERQKNALGFVVAPAGFDYMAKERPKLRPSQVELLDRLCQAAESKAGDFSVTTTWQGAFIKHPGLLAPITDVAVSDLDELGAAGLIRLTRGTGSTRFFAITNKGWEHWEGLRSDIDAVGRIEDSVRRLLDSAPATGPYAEAFERWAAAEAMLWTAREEPAHLTALGTICRDALQRFADVFAREQGHVSQEEASKTITRVVGGIAALRGRLSVRHVKLLDALEVYWRAVDGLAQRQVHAAEKGGEPIAWEDARLVVTQTALVMFELVRAGERAADRGDG